MACSEDVPSPQLCAFTAVFIGIYYGFSMEFLLFFNVFSTDFPCIIYDVSWIFCVFCMDFLCILHGFSVELPCMVLQIHLILFQCLMILPSCIPCYTMICITCLMFFIPLTLTPGSLFYSLVYFVYCLTLSPHISAQETY